MNDPDFDHAVAAIHRRELTRKLRKPLEIALALAVWAALIGPWIAGMLWLLGEVK